MVAHDDHHSASTPMVSAVNIAGMPVFLWKMHLIGHDSDNYKVRPECLALVMQ
jgi:hypothetical protein